MHRKKRYGKVYRYQFWARCSTISGGLAQFGRASALHSKKYSLVRVRKVRCSIHLSSIFRFCGSCTHFEDLFRDLGGAFHRDPLPHEQLRLVCGLESDVLYTCRSGKMAHLFAFELSAFWPCTTKMGYRPRAELVRGNTGHELLVTSLLVYVLNLNLRFTMDAVRATPVP